MTFTEIVAQICQDLNLRGPETLDRVGQKVNARYREVLRRLGMNVYLRTEVDINLSAGTQDQIYDLDDPTLGRLVALYWAPDATTENPNPRKKMLDELTYEEMKEVIPSTDIPRRWCKVRVGNNWTQFKVDSTIPDGATVTVEGEEYPTVLEGDAEPSFENIYHDLLVFGGKADELFKSKDTIARATAKDWEAKFTEGLNALALRQTLMAGGVIKQGKHANYRNPLARRGYPTDGNNGNW
jgi:hypothetical protein